MGEKNQASYLAQSITVSTSKNISGGGVPAESFSLGERLRLANLLTKDNQPRLVALRAPRGARVACARALRTGLAVDAFELSCMELHRIRGAWVVEARSAWPGYVLVEPASGVDPSELADALGAVGALTSLESALVRRLGGATHVIQISQGRIVDGRLAVDFGPLAGLEPLISRIDRHRRLAWLEPEPGRAIAVGLEVTSKS